MKIIWHVDGHDLTSVIEEMPNLGYKHICSCNYGYADPEKHFETNKANAKLIADSMNKYNDAIDEISRLKDIIRKLIPLAESLHFETNKANAKLIADSMNKYNDAIDEISRLKDIIRKLIPLAESLCSKCLPSTLDISVYDEIKQFNS